MTVAVNDTIERYLIAGVGPYAYTWRIFNDTDLQVYALSLAVPPVPTLLANVSDYTVVGANVSSGGSISLSAAAAAAYAGFTLDIRANTPENQPTSIRNTARFLPEIHEDAYDYLSRQIQDLRRLVNAKVGAPDNEPPLAMILPPVATRAGKYEAYDALGLPIASVGTGNDSALRTDLANTVAGNEGARLVGMRRSFAGSVARMQSSINAQQYWLEDVGVARGTDAPTAAANTPKIQALIDAINATSSKCGCINVPQGTWPINATLNIPPGCAVSWEFEVGAILYFVAPAADQPHWNYAGTALAPISGVRMRNVWLWSSNGLGRGITASYLIHYDIEAYFYSLKNGFVGTVCYSGKFTNCNGDVITGDMFRMGDDCNHITFDTCRFLGQNGVLFNGYAHAITYITCSVEGIIAGGAGISHSPAGVKIQHGINVIGLYGENIRTYAIAFAGNTTDSVRNVFTSGLYLTGGFALHFGSVPGNASHAIYHTNVTGFEHVAPYFEDWELDAFQVLGTNTDGSIRRAKRASVPAFSSAAFSKSVELENNFSGRRVEFGTAIPVTSTYAVGDVTWNTNPAAGVNMGWTCIAAGTPGTWSPFGPIQGANPYTVTNPATDRALNVTADTLAQVAAVVGTLIADLQTAGVLK